MVVGGWVQSYTVAAGLLYRLPCLTACRADSGDASSITDIVRAMLVVNSMRDVAKVLECITAMAKEGKIVVVRVKDRYIKSPSAGGWRDDLINFYVKSHRGKIEHIGELQVAHSQVCSGGVCAGVQVCGCAGMRVSVWACVRAQV